LIGKSIPEQKKLTLLRQTSQEGFLFIRKTCEGEWLDQKKQRQTAERCFQKKKHIFILICKIKHGILYTIKNKNAKLTLQKEEKLWNLN